MIGADLATSADVAAILAELRAVRAELADVRASLPPRMISLADAAEALSVDAQTARAMCDRGELTWRRCGRRIVVDAASLRPIDRAVISRLASESRR
jgi:hypothetical protein